MSTRFTSVEKDIKSLVLNKGFHSRGNAYFDDSGKIVSITDGELPGRSNVSYWNNGVMYHGVVVDGWWACSGTKYIQKQLTQLPGIL